MYSRRNIDYNKVMKMSSPAIAEEYYQSFNPVINEDSPLNIYGESGTVELDIRNISFIDKGTVTIPIRRIVKTPGEIIEKYDVVTMDFKYLNKPDTDDDRLINPLGFQVTSYRKDQQLKGIEK